MLLYTYSIGYKLIYDLEDQDTGKKTGNCGKMLNRDFSNGRFKIWGHHIDDLSHSGYLKLWKYDTVVCCDFDIDIDS
jgi:hypothetical protein